MTDAGSRTLLVGRAIDSTSALAGSLDAELIEVPDVGSDDWVGEIERWGQELRAGPGYGRVVVCAWGEPLPPVGFAELDGAGWSDRVERELGLWFEASVAAAARAADGGSMVVVAERPAALDSPGRADVVAVAEGLAVLARSLGITEGRRGLRVNLVASELWTAPRTLLGLPPLLDAFPGRPDVEVAGAVRMLLSDDACGVSGTVVRADCGRSW